MADINPTLSVITISRLNTSIKRHRLTEYLRKCNSFMYCLPEIYFRFKSNRFES